MNDLRARTWPLLDTMARDFRDRGALRRSTAMAMWATYTLHATATAWALIRADDALPVPRHLAPVGWAAVLGGSGLCVAGMSTFATPGEVEGTRNDALVTGGIYRYTRNPQYLGYIAALGGAAVARRSLAAGVLTAAVAAVYSAWIPVEEQQLSGLYGEAYEEYVRTTARWWGRPS